MPMKDKPALKAALATAVLLLAGMSAPTAAVAGPVAGPVFAKAAEQQALEARNRALVLRLYFQFFNKQDVAFARQAISADYIQHNPTIGTGRQPFIDQMQSTFQRFPQANWNVARMAASGDLVWVHSHQTNAPGDPGLAVMDIYRVKDGVIVEHWDSIQAVSTSPANANTQF